MTLRLKECLKMHLRVSVVGREQETWRASEVQEFERECEQKKMNNKLLSQITFTNKEKEKISYLNYLPPTIDESSSDMSCKFISCLMFVRVRILCSVIIMLQYLHFFLINLYFFSRGTCVLDGLRKKLQNTKVDDFK